MNKKRQNKGKMKSDIKVMGRWKGKGGRKVGESVNIKKISKCKKKKNYRKIGKKLDTDIDTDIYIYIYIYIYI